MKKRINKKSTKNLYSSAQKEALMHSEITSTSKSPTTPEIISDINPQKEEIYDELISVARNRLLDLYAIKNQCQKQINNSPKGFIRCQKKGSVVQFYYRTEASDTNGKYIKKENQSLIRSVLQRDYAIRLQKEIDDEIKSIKSLLDSYSTEPLLSSYSSFSSDRRKYIEPLIMSDIDYVEHWIKKDYTPLTFFENEPFLIASNGLRVRSKSEIIIAEALLKNNIPFKYEYPIQLRGLGTVHPDFFCLNVRTRTEFCWEHFGMMDNEKYANYTTAKYDKYQSNGYYPGVNLIITMETSEHPLNALTVQNTILRYLK